MSNKKMLGIDIGSYRLKMVESENGRIRRVITVELPDNLVKNGRVIAYSAMAAFIKATVKKNKLRYKTAAVSISAENYFIRRVRLPLMSRSLLAVNLPFEFHDYISGDLGKYVFDYAVLDSDDKNLDLIAAAAPKDLINNYRVMMKKAGLKLVKVVPDVLAISAMLYHPERIVDLTKSKKEVRIERRKVEKELRKEQVIADKERRKHEAEQKAADRQKKKADKRLEKSGYIVGRHEDDDYEDAAGAGIDEISFGNSTEAAHTDMEEDGAAGSDNIAAEHKKSKDYVVLDIGYRNAGLHFFSDNTFEITRTMDEGEMQIAKAVADEHGMDIHIAMLKLENNQDGILSEQLVTDKFDMIATDIMRVMNFYSYNNPKNTVDRIYYFGGCSEIKPLINAIAQSTDLPLYPLTDLIPGLTPKRTKALLHGPQAFGATIE